MPGVGLGDVLYLQCNLCDPPKPKFFVVAQADPLRLLLINSEINRFVWAKPRSRALHLLLRQADHSDFLVHDSYLACDHLSHEYSAERVAEILRDNPAAARGRLHDSVRPKLAVAFRDNHLIQGKYLRELRPLWEEWIDPLPEYPAG